MPKSLGITTSDVAGAMLIKLRSTYNKCLPLQSDYLLYRLYRVIDDLVKVAGTRWMREARNLSLW